MRALLLCRAVHVSQIEHEAAASELLSAISAERNLRAELRTQKRTAREHSAGFALCALHGAPTGLPDIARPLGAVS